MTKLPDLKNWQKEFDEKWKPCYIGEVGEGGAEVSGYIKDFISSLLQSQQEQRDGEIIKELESATRVHKFIPQSCFEQVKKFIEHFDDNDSEMIMELNAMSKVELVKKTISLLKESK